MLSPIKDITQLSIWQDWNCSCIRLSLINHRANSTVAVIILFFWSGSQKSKWQHVWYKWSRHPGKHCPSPWMKQNGLFITSLKINVGSLQSVSGLQAVWTRTCQCSTSGKLSPPSGWAPQNLFFFSFFLGANSLRYRFCRCRRVNHECQPNHMKDLTGISRRVPCPSLRFLFVSKSPGMLFLILVFQSHSCVCVVWGICVFCEPCAAASETWLHHEQQPHASCR